MTYITLPEYVCLTKQNIDRYGADGNIVFNSTLSNAMVLCYNVALGYANHRSLKNLPMPISCVVKSDPDSGETFTQLRFSTDININTLEKVCSLYNNKTTTIQVNPNNSSICVDIYTQTNRDF